MNHERIRKKDGRSRELHIHGHNSAKRLRNEGNRARIRGENWHTNQRGVYIKEVDEFKKLRYSNIVIKPEELCDAEALD